MLHIIFVETALETIPLKIKSHPSVRNDAKRRKKEVSEILLDRSLHHSAMLKLKEASKRGRPDIVHLCLLNAMGTPLNKKGKLRLWIHTIGNYTIELSPDARLPKNYNRFRSLMEQLFIEKRVPPKKNVKALMKMDPMSLEELVKMIEPEIILALTSHGVSSNLDEVSDTLVDEDNASVLIGAFPHGPFSNKTLALSDGAVSIYPEPLEAWIVTSRLIHEYEKKLEKKDQCC